MKLLNKELEESPLYQLSVNLRTAEEVYKAAVYGATHNEAQILQILGKTGLKSSEQKLEKEKYKNAIAVLKALSSDKKLIDLVLSKAQVRIIRVAVKLQLKMVQNIPQLGREQILITYATLLEGFINDTIRNYLTKFPQSLKSNKATLKDNQLIDSIIEGNTLEKLIDSRVRDLMYDSITGWIKYLDEKGLNIIEENSLKEMFLVRNVLIHNNKKVGLELSKGIGGIRYKIGKQINVTENDIKRYKLAIERMSTNINTEYLRKTKN